MPSKIAIDDPDATYAWKINQVAMCGVCLDQQADWYEVHHIIKRGRSDEPCNYLLLCERCHRVVEGHRVYDEKLKEYLKPISLANALWAKMERNPTEWLPDRLAELHQRPLPKPEPIADQWLIISARNDPFNIYRKH